KRAAHGHDAICLVRLRVEDRRAAVGAEVKDVLLPVGLVGDPGEVGVASRDAHLLGREPGLPPEGASGPALAGEAVADRDRQRLSIHCQTQLPTATGGLAGSHRGRILQTRFLTFSPLRTLTRENRRFRVPARIVLPRTYYTAAFSVDALEGEKPWLPGLFFIGAPSFELGHSSPPDSFSDVAGMPTKWREVASLSGFRPAWLAR